MEDSRLCQEKLLLQLRKLDYNLIMCFCKKLQFGGSDEVSELRCGLSELVDKKLVKTDGSDFLNLILGSVFKPL